MDVVKHPAQNCFYETKTPEPAKVRESAFRGGRCKSCAFEQNSFALQNSFRRQARFQNKEFVLEFWL